MVEDGKTVKVHYKGTLNDGSVFDTSEGRDPLAFQLGESQVIQGFEAAIKEMAVGETKTINIPSDEAYGARRDEMVATIPKAEFPDNIDPKEGMMLQMQTDRGPLPLKVVSVSEDDVTVDGNHPLAGQDLTFELTLVEVA